MENDMITLILALNHQHAIECANELGLNRRQWRYIMSEEDFLGYRPNKDIKIVAYVTASNSIRRAARSRGFEIIEL